VPVPFREFSVAFGDYVEAYEGTDNTSGARSAACIALCPVGNSTGSWILWKMETRVRVRRTNFQKLVTSELVINQMNALAQEYEEEMLHPGMQIPEQQSTEEEKETEDLEGNPKVNLEELPEDVLDS
jgi:hypothetical protein